MIRTTYKAVPITGDLINQLEDLLEQAGDILDELEDREDPRYQTYKGLHDMLGSNDLMAGTATPPTAAPARPGAAVGLLPKASSDYSRGNTTAKAANQEKARQSALDKVATGGRSAAFLADMFGRKGGQ